jgi:hypothetical protein
VLVPNVQQSTNWHNYRLARLLKVSVSELEQIQIGPRYHYRPFAIQKADGRERRILASSPALKQLQRQLLRKHLLKLPVHPAATAFRKGSSVVKNARQHLGRALVATVDLEDFFETTSAPRVRGFFLANGWWAEALTTLMRLCVYRGGLPQGAPTSPALSNVVNHEMDSRLSQISSRGRAHYTRYGDDLTFSWKQSHLPSNFQVNIENVLREYGYRVQPRKAWKVTRIEDEPEVTGVVLGRDGQLHPSHAVQTETEQLRQHLRWHDDDEESQQRLRGYEAYMQMFGE